VHKSIIRAGLATTAIVALLAAGCGDDDSGDDDSDGDDAAAETEGASGRGGSDLDRYCETVLAIDQAQPDVDFESASPEEMTAGLKTFASETLRPLVADAAAAAPEEVSHEVEVMSGAVDEMARSGDFAVFEQPEVSAADDTLHAFELDNCGWQRQDVTAVEYGFEGIPDELATGPTSFELTNDGEELHELQQFRKNDGVTETAQELLALPEEEAMSKVTQVGSGAFAPPGETEYTVVDLEAGDYVAVCFVPTGMTSEDQEPAADAPPHFAHGMVAELTVR
jgi:hypothetical protein